MVSKYKNVKTVVDGIKFDSKKEAKRYGELKLLEKARKIAGLHLQPRLTCSINGVKICDYRADFLYRKVGEVQFTYEDCKGTKTAVYRLKKSSFMRFTA